MLDVVIALAVILGLAILNAMAIDRAYDRRPAAHPENPVPARVRKLLALAISVVAIVIALAVGNTLFWLITVVSSAVLYLWSRDD